jgi:hypothetical protein
LGPPPFHMKKGKGKGKAAPSYDLPTSKGKRQAWSHHLPIRKRERKGQGNGQGNMLRATTSPLTKRKWNRQGKEKKEETYASNYHVPIRKGKGEGRCFEPPHFYSKLLRTTTIPFERGLDREMEREMSFKPPPPLLRATTSPFKRKRERERITCFETPPPIRKGKEKGKMLRLPCSNSIFPYPFLCSFPFRMRE